MVYFVVLVITGYTHCFAQNPDVDIVKGINPRHPTSLYWRNTSNSAYYAVGAASFGTLIYGLVSNNEIAKRNATETFISVGASVPVTHMIKLGVNRTHPADKYPMQYSLIQ